ncbi:hypothetical protein [Streptomyces sp. NPDC048411]|uniref:hypothetical protein n=1 Tax=Streptomyces sp. NPDC048411 TaxID=3157206 RepID=UPI003456AF49
MAIDNALARHIAVPARSIIDDGTDSLVQHLRSLLEIDYGQDNEGGAGVRALFRVAYRNLDVAVRPTPATPQPAAYTYWRNIAGLTAAFRDLYLKLQTMEQA